MKTSTQQTSDDQTRPSHHDIQQSTHNPTKRMNRMPTLSSLWHTLHTYAWGRWIFSKLIGLYAPYSGSVKAHVLQMDQEQCCVTFKERRAIRNHLNSIHAIALINLGEIVTGLRVMYVIDGIGRGIVRALHIHYHKKSRGRIVAVCHDTIPTQPGTHQLTVYGKLYNAQKELVAEISAEWQIEIYE